MLLLLQAARYEHEVNNARDEINGLKTEVRQLSDKLDDTQYR
jgi:HAMP domain-containing protein